MKIEQIRQVLAINRCGSINKAAEELFLSQPNLSISVKNLEDELGYRIFIRSSHGVRLTHHGKIFVQSASVVMDQFDSLARLKRLPKENEDEEQKLIKFRSDLGQSYIAAFAMGFPGVKGVDKAKHYKVNKVYYTQNLMDEPEELDDEDE